MKTKFKEFVMGIAAAVSVSFSYSAYCVTRAFTANGVQFTMVLVEGGTFTMGATPEQFIYAQKDEQFAHSVTLSDYYMGETEVTQELWEAVMGKNPSYFRKKSKNPVESVSWNDCQIFIKKLNALTGENFSLPTEAQWEFAARGGNSSNASLYAGGNNIDDVAWHKGNCGRKTHEVATKKPNELGLYDMSGNVCEWCQDYYYRRYPQEAQTNPLGIIKGNKHVLRGGRWNTDASDCRVSRRMYDNSKTLYFFQGLRLALPAPKNK